MHISAITFSERFIGSSQIVLNDHFKTLNNYVFVFFQFVIRFIQLDELDQFNYSQSSKTQGYWKLFCLLLLVESLV